MANKKYTELPQANAITGAEILAMVQDGGSVQGDIDLIKDYFDTLYAPVATVARFYADTMAGHGSTATKIMYYTNTPTNTPASQFTIANSATNGLSATINVAGLYAVVATFDTGIGYAGLSLNASSLTTSIESIAVGERLAMVYVAPLGYTIQAVSVRRFAVNDVIRPHTSGQAASTAAWNTFNLERIGG